MPVEGSAVAGQAVGRGQKAQVAAVTCTRPLLLPPAFNFLQLKVTSARSLLPSALCLLTVEDHGFAGVDAVTAGAAAVGPWNSERFSAFQRMAAKMRLWPLGWS